MKPFIVANWKCNPASLKGAKLLFDSVARRIKNVRKVEVVICPPFIYLSNIQHLKSNIQLGGQDCFWEEKGAYTGEISPSMLKDLGVEYVIIGHSERRKYLKETDEMVNKKIEAALKQGLKPILCIDKISQLKKDLEGVIIAYEPLFAIGTGKPCSIGKAKKMRILIKKNLKRGAPILYGGSVNSQNAQDYIKKAGFQGLLVGSASLNSKEFLSIVKGIDSL